MADESTLDDLEENILYDLTIATEWPQEPETIFQSKIIKDKEKLQVSLAGRFTSVAYRSLWTFLRSVGVSIRTASPCNLPIELVRLVNSHIHWHLAISQDGRHMAILQDQLLETRSSQDDFSAAVGRCAVPIDPYPQWRTVAWSQAGDMVASSSSTGDVCVFDFAGTSIVNIPSTVLPTPNSPVDLSHAVVALIFKGYKNKGDNLWQEELLVINYQGALHSYLISLDGTFCLNHQFTFSTHYPRGLSCSVYLPAYDLLILGGPAIQTESSDTCPLSPADCGLSLWRSLSDYPHYKMVTDYDQDLQTAQTNIVARLRNITFPTLNWRRNGQDGIFQMSCSPNNKMMTAVHYTGTVSVWHIPSLRLAGTWPLREQPGYDEVNPEVIDNPRLKKQLKDSLNAFHLMDANWWSDDAMILVRGTGSLAVSSVKTLRNLLGTSPEWFAPVPVVTPAIDGGFLALECEAKQSAQKRRLLPDEADEYEDSDDELDATVVTKTTRYVKWVLHYVTDMERFQPPRKRPKVITKTYRLINLKSTTPEELYHRKIEHEEYGEALELAKVYGLDCDQVYQRQWRRSPVSVASIQDYLSKISKRSWVLNDCMQRVPENIDAMRELLEYGLRGTDLEALQAIGRNEDGGRFIQCETATTFEESLDFLDEEAIENAKEAAAEHRRNLAASVDFGMLSLEQRELCRARTKLLQYIDRLSTYEEILGGIYAAEERFNPKFFEDFRSQNIVELAISYAQKCDWRALEVLFKYHGLELLEHRLAILSNFPETCPPAEYRSLLPEAGWRDEDPEVLPWDEDTWRRQDWVEMDECREAINPNPQNAGDFLYQETPDLAPFIGEILTQEQLTEWYAYRACTIERLARQVEHGLELVKYGMERNVQGLDRLCDDLITMDMLVYECYVDDSVTFENLQAMDDIDKLRLVMSTSFEEMYMKNVRRWMVPFLKRCEKHEPGCPMIIIREYLVTLAKDDLTCCQQVFEISKADQLNPVISVDNELISMALECIYAFEGNDQLSNAFGILECLPQRGFGKVSKASSLLHNQVDELESHLIAAEILERHGLPQNISHIRNSQNDPEEARALFTKLMRFAGRKTPPLSPEDWNILLGSMLELRDKVYRCVQSTVCYEIYVENLLCSSRLENIRLAAKNMECSMSESKEPIYSGSDRSGSPVPYKVVYTRAIELVLSAAQEYFNSSAVLTDNCMELARQCLKLITDESDAVAEEIDLIDSLAILDGFGVSMLPLQVRMTTDRLNLIQKAIDAKRFIYKNSQRLLRLARLLRVCGNNETEREGQVLKLVAQVALKARDLRVVHDTCIRLMEAGYAPMWDICKTLAQDEHFMDKKAKLDLLAFAVTHCTGDMLQPILQAKCYIEAQILFEQLQASGHSHDSQSPSPTRETSPFTARMAIQQTQEILSATTSTSKKVLAAVSDKNWWTRTIKSLHPSGRDADYAQEWDDRNASFARQGCHPFYSDLMKGSYTNNIEADYHSQRLRPAAISGLQFNEAVLHLSSLEQMLTESSTESSASTVLVQLAEDVIQQDCTLGLAYLLALPEPLDADPLFKKLPRSSISLQLATYYYALQLGARLIHTPERHQGSLYTHDPSDVISAMLMITKDNSNISTEAGPRAEELIERLHYYNELMTDLTQAQVLDNLSKDVDVARFTQDDEYKQQTILGLAMTTEQTVYETALSLATRYKLRMWEVYMTHLEHLFDCGMPLVQLEERVVQQGLMYALSEEAAELSQRMVQFVYPSIAGTDHARLIYYYSLLEAGKVPPDQRVAPDVHKRLLKKIRPAAPGLDYKQLMDGTETPLQVIRPVLNTGNVHVLAKLAPKIPDQRGGFLQPSVVFCAWAVKMFWSSDKKEAHQPDAQINWIKRYEQCAEYMNKLNPDDMIQFIEAIVFVPQALDKLGLECRQEIVHRAIKFCKQGNNKKKGRDAGVSSEASWKDAMARMQQSLDHLGNLDNPVIDQLAESEDPQVQQYARLYDLSQSETEKVHDLCVTMVLDGQPGNLVSEVLNILPGNTWQAQTAVREGLGIIISALRTPDSVSSLLEDRALMDTLNTVVTRVHTDRSSDSDLVSVDDVMTLLRPFCADVTVPVKPRLAVLSILEQTFELNDSDLILLICYRTNAIISTGWNDRKVSDKEVGTDAGRQALFDELLTTSSRLCQFTALTDLLKVWPSLTSINERSEEPEKHPWCQAVIAMVTYCKQEAIDHVLQVTEELKDESPLSVKCVRYLFKKIVACDMWLLATKVALISGHTELHDDVLEEIAKQDGATDDPVLCRLLLQHHLVARIVGTPYYQIVVNYVISQQSPGDDMPYYLSVETIANQLQDLGHVVEAASLLMAYRGTHPMLRTFDMSYSVLTRWFDRQ